MIKKKSNIKIWQKLKGNILKIVSNPKKGTIKVYNEKGKLIIKKTNLTAQQVRDVEDNVLIFMTNRLNSVGNRQQNKDQFDPLPVVVAE